MSDNDIEPFLSVNKDAHSKDVKYNIFKFQDYLNEQIVLCSRFFLLRDYASAFETLQNIFIDTNGFYTPEEKTELYELYKHSRTDKNKYEEYRLNYQAAIKNKKKVMYNPPCEVYHTLIDFKFKLMECMAKHQLLIPLQSKGIGGALGL